MWLLFIGLQVWSTLLTVNTSFLDVDWYVIILKELICKRISDLVRCLLLFSVVKACPPVNHSRKILRA